MPKGTSFPVFTLTTETFWMSIVKCLQNLGKRKGHFDYWFMLLGSPDGSERKKSACSTEGWGLIPGSGRSPGEGNGYPLQLRLPGEFHEQRSLVRYCPWVCKESNTTGWLRLSVSYVSKDCSNLRITWDIIKHRDSKAAYHTQETQIA